MSRSVVSAAITCLLTACATSYQPLGLKGGYSHVQLDANSYKVSFRGNAYTSRDRVETYLMYRLAELTAEAGYDYFVVVGSRTDASQGVGDDAGNLYVDPTTGSATAFGSTAYGSATTTGTYTPGQTFIVTKHGGVAVIKVFKGEKPTNDPNAFVAREVLHYLGPSIGR